MRNRWITGSLLFLVLVSGAFFDAFARAEDSALPAADKASASADKDEEKGSKEVRLKGLKYSTDLVTLLPEHAFTGFEFRALQVVDSSGRIQDLAMIRRMASHLPAKDEEDKPLAYRAAYFTSDQIESFVTVGLPPSGASFGGALASVGDLFQSSPSGSESFVPAVVQIRPEGVPGYDPATPLWSTSETIAPERIVAVYIVSLPFRIPTPPGGDCDSSTRLILSDGDISVYFPNGQLAGFLNASRNVATTDCHEAQFSSLVDFMKDGTLIGLSEGSLEVRRGDEVYQMTAGIDNILIVPSTGQVISVTLGSVPIGGSRSVGGIVTNTPDPPAQNTDPAERVAGVHTAAYME